ncbi:hypothetical protein [Catellatospora bangladeshensis]|uniref:Uncharacterized protein n=2 Tax=Catellatospora bangladeshensis TaxID=310355 RepID=A0A8J3JRG3_9ACTN|nr:hypothetical protein [Catellatospora bangladeshensis]GIF83568.1 hypothetical protein Cba03nite_49170 [Catellatospora bangladeshensis]
MIRRRVAAAVAVAVLAVAGVVVVRWWHERPPFTPDVINASVTVDMLGVGTDGMEGERSYDGVSYLPSPGDAFVGGHLRWTPPPGAATDWEDGWFVLLVIDKRVDLKPPMVIGRSDSSVRVVQGSDGVLNEVAEKYPWLRGAGDVRTGEDTWLGSTTTVMTSPAGGPITFVATFPAQRRETPQPPTYATAPVNRDDLLVALVFIGPDRQVYWAQRLFG